MGFIIGTIILGVIIASFFKNKSKTKELETLKQAYDRALKGPDKRAALEAGRTYYSSLRKDKILSVYDEQAITNDLSTMLCPS
jgi:hypothetical protein